MTNRQFRTVLVGLGWTQADAARELGVSLRTITRYVAGEGPRGAIPRAVALALKAELARRPPS